MCHVPRKQRWTDAELRNAVAEAKSLGRVCVVLGLRPGGGTYATLRRHIKRLAIDDAHLPRLVDGRVGCQRSWTDDDLRRAVTASTSVAEVQRRLGFEPNGGMHRSIKSHIRRLGLNTDHFLGQGWARGRTPATRFQSQPLEEILVRDSNYTSTSGLRKRLISAGLKQPRCENCGRDTWLDQPLSLALDHINGDTRDNRLENLRILCPNCHSITDTWCGRKNGPAYSNRQRDIA